EARHGDVAVLEELDPRFDAETLRTAVARRSGEAAAVALVGHEPQLSSLLAALSGVAQADLDFKKGAIVRIDVDNVNDGKSVDARGEGRRAGARRARGSAAGPPGGGGRA